MRRMHDGDEENMDGGKCMSRKEILGRVRMQVQLVRTLSGQVKELSGSGLRSIRLDGAPRVVGSLGRGLDVRMEKKDALERMLRKESSSCFTVFFYIGSHHGYLHLLVIILHTHGALS